MRARRCGALALPAGVLAVHQLRYLLAYGSGAGHELRAHGDTYVGPAVPVVTVLLPVASIAALARFANAWRDGGHQAAPFVVGVVGRDARAARRFLRARAP